MIAKNIKTRKIEAKLLLDMSNKIFIGVMLSWITLNFIDNTVKFIITFSISTVLLILALNLNKRMLLILDDIENEETKNERA